MSKHLTVGSLFAGIGGFDLAAERAGMEVKWQSQWEPPRWGWNTIAKKIKNRKVKAGLRENPKFGRWIDDPQKASLVLDHHFPDILNYGDIHEIRNPPAVDILCGGFPCQDYSVAGARHGLAGDRGALWWEFHRLIDEVRPTWVVAENVPGLLSSRGGRDFETIIRSLTQLGYGVVWGILDAQYFGVAQRRRRVFIVGHSGGVPRPEVLALGEGLFGHPAPSREQREGVAPTLASRTRGGGGLGTDFDLDGGLITHGFDELNGELNPELHQSLRAGTKQSTGVVSFPWQASWDASQEDGTTPTLPANQSLAVAFSAGNHESSYGIGLSVEHTPPLRAGESGTNQVPTVAFAQNQHALVYSEGSAENYRQVEATDAITEGAGSRRIEQIVFESSRRDGVRVQDDQSPTLQAQMGTGGLNTPMVAFAQNQRDEVRELEVASSVNAQRWGTAKNETLLASTITEQERVPGRIESTMVPSSASVRRLTPLECERLQGFPDNWTAVPGNSDTQRYKQLGNAVAVPVAEWIFRRILAAESGRIL